VRRREFITLLGSAAAWPLAARAQQQAMPTIAYLGPTSPEAVAGRLRAFRQGLKEIGYIEGENVAIGYLMERAIATFARSANGGLIVTASALAFTHRNLIVTLAARHKLPAVYFSRPLVTAGGLASYGPDTLDQFQRAAGYIDRILKGEKPADLPVQAPTKYELVINLKTAKALGITVPQTLLALADEVID
jgi:ABC transporter substrate binding protein